MTRGRAGPLVIAVFRQRSGPPHPTVVTYGHLDVKPPGTGWSSPPFEPTRRDYKLVARGASDDKGQLMAHVAAAEAWQRIGGPPCDVAIVVDGAEEVGSPGVPQILARWWAGHPLANDVAAVLISDTRGGGPGQPSITTAQRGALSVHLSIDTGGQPVHAGRFGGAVIDPTLTLARALLRIEGAAGALEASCGGRIRLPPDAGVRCAGHGRAVRSSELALRSTLRGACTVTAIRAGVAAGTIPTSADAAVDVRVPPGMDARSLAQDIADLVTSGLPEGTRATVHTVATSNGMCLVPDAAASAAVDTACQFGYNRAPALVPSGASIPIVSRLADLFGVTPILLGFGPADDGAHGPNEYLDLRDWPRSVDTCVALLAALARNDRFRQRTKAVRVAEPETPATRTPFGSAELTPHSVRRRTRNGRGEGAGR